MRVALYAEVSMNLIDGSSIWVESVAQMLTTLPWVNVSVLLRSAEKRDLLTAPLREHPRIALIEPESLGHEGPLDPGEAMDCLLSLDSERGFDVVMLRGRGVSEEICRADAFPGGCGSTTCLHTPEPGSEVDHLRQIAPASTRILCQTKAVEGMAEAATGSIGRS